MTRKLGIIAEDVSDIEVIKILARRISGKTLNSCHFVGKGCGKLKVKTPGWCKSLNTKGCDSILLVHDRDRNDAKKLRLQLEQMLEEAPQNKKIVVIPEEELEAWLLSDPDAINEALKLEGKFKVGSQPENIGSPKEYLRDNVYKSSNKKKQYVNSVHNKVIAEIIDTDKIFDRCQSFKPFFNLFKVNASKKIKQKKISNAL